MVAAFQIEQLEYQGRVPVTVIQISGEIDVSNYTQLQALASQLAEAGRRHLLLDLSQVTYVSSAGLRALHAIYTMLPPPGDESLPGGLHQGSFKSPYLKLLNPRPNVRRSLELVGFDMFLETHSDLEQAIASF